MVYFARMVDKIRLRQRGELPEDLVPNLGIAFDAHCCELLGVSYQDLVAKTEQGLSDAELLEWAAETGGRPSAMTITLWNEALPKRGWKDGLSAKLEMRKAESGMANRADIQVMFDYIDADEGRELTCGKEP